jgi:heme exporter protein D
MIGPNALEWLAMGGYGQYVWGSLGVSLWALALEVWRVGVGRQQALEAVCEVMDANEDAQAGDAA